MATALKLPLIVEGGRYQADGYWSGAGRYERGDRRDRSLTHWRYGARVDAARIRRLRAMLDANWHQINPTGQRGKRFRTAIKILTEIARSYNTVQRISFITKATIAATLNLHRNTVYQHCKSMEQAGILLQGHYEAHKGGDYKTYSVFAIAGMTGQLPVLLRFKRRHARHVRMVSITWPIATLARYGQHPLPQFGWPTLVTPANENLFKNVHGTCDKDLYLQQAVCAAPKSAAKRLKGDKGATASPRQVMFVAANRGQNVRYPPQPALKGLHRAQQGGLEGRALRFSTSHHDRQLSGVERIRSVMQAYERDFGHLENCQPIVGFPRGWMRKRVLAITDKDWGALVQLVLSRPLLCGTAPMQDGRVFQLNFWWLMQEAPRLLAQVAKPAPPHDSHRPSRQSKPSPPKPLSRAARNQMIDDIRTHNPDLAKILAGWAVDLDAERPPDE